MKKPLITIDIVSDVMCPWCYIGKRRLDNALAELTDKIDSHIEWLPYQLDSTLPKQGKDRKQYFIDKFGSLEAYAEIYKPIHLAGKSEGIPFRLDDIEVSPNTLDAHRLIYWAKQEYSSFVQNNLVSILMGLFFEDAKNIGNNDVLVEAAERAGMNGKDREKIKKKLEGNDDRDHIQNQVKAIRAMGVNGVPFFILNKKHTLQGAQPKENIIDLIQYIINNT